ITGSELPDAPAPAVQGGLIEPLPEATASEILGLLEYLVNNGGQQDLFRIAADTDRELGRVITVVKAAEMLNFVDAPKSIGLTAPDGRRVIQAEVEQRKVIWREQLLKLRLFRELNNLLGRNPQHELDKEFVLELFVTELPQENYERLFDTFVLWARV